MAETACPVFHLKTLFAHVLFKNSVSHPAFFLEVAINDRFNRFKAVFCTQNWPYGPVQMVSENKKTK